MIKPFHISTLTFYIFISFSLLTPAMAETLTSVVTHMETEEEALEDLDLDSAALDNSPPQYSQPNSVEPDFKWGWTDETRKEVKDKLNAWAHEMDDWFGDPDPQKPATASLRIVMDSSWANDPVAGSDVSFRPRIRGRLRLPVLERRLSLIIGDEELEDDTFLKQAASTESNQGTIGDQDGFIDSKRTREENAAIALRWSNFNRQIEEKLGIKTDLDVGIRSLDDLYVKVSVDKDWYQGDKLSIRNDNFYRYGLDSEHYVRGGLSIRYGRDTERFIHNRTTVRYRHRDEEEDTNWSNDLRQVQRLGNQKQLAYGISTSGYFDDAKSTLNSYGPAISYRQPIWREWLYIQTELGYYNDRTLDKEHYPSALLRVEAFF